MAMVKNPDESVCLWRDNFRSNGTVGAITADLRKARAAMEEPMTEQLSKSARRRARKKRAKGQPQPVAPVEAHEPEPDPEPGHGVPVTLQIPPRHMEVVKWMLKVASAVRHA
jgi:hypothetical protein